ncbi:hypothetical protein BDP67DRAFT_537218 [Colletotrichum lupini]|nr:hypothetical protein BDP67DRAFT_537218 [Colletotrichum lupini]
MSERRAKPVLDQPPPAYGIRECRGRSQAESVDTGQTRKSPGRQFHFVRLCARGPPRLGSWQPSIPPNFAPRRCGMRKFPLSSDRLRGSRIGLQSPDSRAFSSLQSILYSYGCFAQSEHVLLWLTGCSTVREKVRHLLADDVTKSSGSARDVARYAMVRPFAHGCGNDCWYLRCSALGLVSHRSFRGLHFLRVLWILLRVQGQFKGSQNLPCGVPGRTSLSTLLSKKVNSF